MALKDDIIKNAGHFYSLSHPQSHHPLPPPPYYHRFLSWEHCYDEFGKVFSGIHTAITNADKDLLALHLATYLASWGMYRGSSFLLQVDYKVHVPVVELITEKDPVVGTIFKYRDLFGIEWSKLSHNEKTKNLELLFGSSNAIGLSDAISGYYEKIRTNVKGAVKSEVSKTLVTKVLMGTLGCVPAYDTYFTKGIKKANITSNFSKKSISALINFYYTNRLAFDNARATMIIPHDKKYPEMKFLDMGFWGY